MRRITCAIAFAQFVSMWVSSYAFAQAKGPVKVFVLAGQSNMEGKAAASTLEPLIQDETTRERFKHLKSGKNWTVRDDVWVTYLDREATDVSPRAGKLTVGFGSPKRVRIDGKREMRPGIGPELGIGWVLGERYDEPVLLIKTAWGGRAVKQTFRPPSAPPTEQELQDRLKQVRRKNPQQTLEELKASYGSDYRKIVVETKRVLAEIDKYCPAYDPQAGYELSGFIWFQGWNDGVGGGNPNYAEQMRHFIRDMRRDLGSAQLPFVIGELGIDGAEASGWVADFREQQAAIAATPEFKGTVKLARTAHCWHAGPPSMAGKWEAFRKLAKANESKSKDDPTRVDPGEFFQQNWAQKYKRELAYTSDRRYHYNGSGRAYYEMGESMATAMIELLDNAQR